MKCERRSKSGKAQWFGAQRELLSIWIGSELKIQRFKAIERGLWNQQIGANKNFARLEERKTYEERRIGLLDLIGVAATACCWSLVIFYEIITARTRSLLQCNLRFTFTQIILFSQELIISILMEFSLCVLEKKYWTKQIVINKKISVENFLFPIKNGSLSFLSVSTEEKKSFEKIFSNPAREVKATHYFINPVSSHSLLLLSFSPPIEEIRDGAWIYHRSTQARCRRRSLPANQLRSRLHRISRPLGISLLSLSLNFVLLGFFNFVNFFTR